MKNSDFPVRYVSHYQRVSWFISSSNYSYISYIYLINHSAMGVMFTNLANYKVVPPSYKLVYNPH